MDTTTDGQLCFGIIFPEDFNFPWDEEKYEGDIDKWWREIKGYKPPFELFDENGNYIDKASATKEKVDEYFNHRHEFDRLNPVHVSLVNYCSGSAPMYILAVEGSYYNANTGSPRMIDPDELKISAKQSRLLINFIEENIENLEDVDMIPKWYLSSYWV